jgi:hypothetical protein
VAPAGARQGAGDDGVLQVGVNSGSEGHLVVLETQRRTPFAPLLPCSCETQRGEDADLSHDASTVFFTDENSACLQGQTQVSNGVAFVAGTFVWTMHE